MSYHLKQPQILELFPKKSGLVTFFYGTAVDVADKVDIKSPALNLLVK